METVTIEAKLTPKLLEELENIIKGGWYTDRSEAIRDAVRKLIMERRLSKEERIYRKGCSMGTFWLRQSQTAGPIIHLSEVNCFDALQIADVVIPSAVYHEVTRYDKPGSKELQNSHMPVIRIDEEEKVFAMQLCSAYGIDAGESEAITLCLSRKYGLFFY